MTTAARKIDPGAARARLDEARAELQGQLDAFPIADTDDDDDRPGQHPGDDASDMFLRERNLVLRHNIETHLAEIEAAFHRIDEGTYGVCERCGEPINPERLEAIPDARFCVTCQSAVDKEREAA